MGDTAKAQPWEQRPDESGRAYAAFVVYRDMGAKRNVPDAYRQGTGRPQAKQASGVWNGWAKKYRWAERARAYDEHQAALRQKGIEQATVESGRAMAQIRDRCIREGLDRWQERLRQADMVSAMPPVQRTVAQGGQVVTYEAVDVLDRYRATMIGIRAQQALFDLLDRGLEIERGTEAAQARADAEARPPGDPSEAERRGDAWRAGQRRKLITYDPTRPPGQLEAPEPEPEPDVPRRNGSGVPPVPASST